MLRDVSQLESIDPDFVIVAVAKAAQHDVVERVATLGHPVLCETPPGLGSEQVRGLVERHADVQVAEQYFLRPSVAARLSLVESGLIGETTDVSVSFAHGYHGASLVRRFVGCEPDEPVRVSAISFDDRLQVGPTRDGHPVTAAISTSARTVALIEIGNRLARFEFAREQYFSPIRSSSVNVRGTRGEIFGNRVLSYRGLLATDFELTRRSHDEMSLIDRGLDGYFCGADRLYANPFPEVSFTDEEIAVASCLDRMRVFVDGGPPHYPVEEALIDMRLSELVDHAVRMRRPVVAAGGLTELR
ncbi:MAG: gfo/Idh/MocA family oxidoreductase [Sulfitobacter sp.]|nr:gfo/Idh/MocA family oxidoreductase [Sulfitobacter sp.]